MPPQSPPSAPGVPTPPPVSASPEAVVPNPNPAPAASSSAQPSAMNAEPHKSGSKLWLVLVGVIVLLLLIGGAVLFYLNSQQKAVPDTAEETQPVATPVSQVDDLNKDLESATPDEVDPDFQSTDKDLQSL